MKRLVSCIVFGICLFSMISAVCEYSDAYTDIQKQLENLSDDELTALIVDIWTEQNRRVQETVADTPDVTASPEPTVTAEITKRPLYLGMWKQGYFVDRFQNPTTDKYIINKTGISGTFSNSAATNKELKAYILISVRKGEPFVEIELFEYGSMQVKNYLSDSVSYEISIQTGYLPGYTTLKGAMDAKGDRIHLTGSHETFMNKLIYGGSPVKIYIEEKSRYSMSTYLFTIDDTSGIFDAYSWLMEGVAPKETETPAPTVVVLNETPDTAEDAQNSTPRTFAAEYLSDPTAGEILESLDNGDLNTALSLLDEFINSDEGNTYYQSLGDILYQNILKAYDILISGHEYELSHLTNLPEKARRSIREGEAALIRALLEDPLSSERLIQSADALSQLITEDMQ